MRTSVLCAAACGWACASAAPPPAASPPDCKAQTLHVGVTTSRSLDPAADRRPRPVELRLYLLHSDEPLTAASFRQVWSDPKATLKESLIAERTLAVYPDSHLELALERAPEAAFLAAVALFREPKEQSWRSILSLQNAGPSAHCAAACSGDDCPAPASACDVCVGFVLDETRIEVGAPAEIASEP